MNPATPAPPATPETTTPPATTLATPQAAMLNHTPSNPLKLGQNNLTALASSVSVFNYARQQCSKSIVHIGVGGFFRAHQAVYLDDLQQLAETDTTDNPTLSTSKEWGYCGIGLLESDQHIRNALWSQDCLYTVVERDAQGDTARIIGSLLEFIYAPTNPDAAIEKMADPSCRIVSLTITEGGYYINQGNGEFNPQHPDIHYELSQPAHPRCSFGYLAAALERRRTRGLLPFTIMSCDNLQNNGDITKKMLLAFVTLLNPALASWLAEHGAFPNSMVDRITPATNDEHRQMVRQQFGIDDAWPVVTEPFKQWVIEDHFPGGRPAWEKVGAQMTSDVLPYEKMKLRLLNASHQALCYIGMLKGYTYAHEAMADQDICTLVTTMMDDEVTALLSPVQGIDLTLYKKTLIERFSNPAIRDQLARIGTEGSARIPKFVLPSIQEQLERNGPITLLCFTVAAWFRYLTGSTDDGHPLPINDPFAATLTANAIRGKANPHALLSMRELFGELTEAPRFIAQLENALGLLHTMGSGIALSRILESCQQ